MTARIVQRGQYWEVVVESVYGTITRVGRYTAKYKAKEHAARLNKAETTTEPLVDRYAPVDRYPAPIDRYAPVDRYRRTDR